MRTFCRSGNLSVEGVEPLALITTAIAPGAVCGASGAPDDRYVYYLCYISFRLEVKLWYNNTNSVALASFEVGRVTECVIGKEDPFLLCVR